MKRRLTIALIALLLLLPGGSASAQFVTVEKRTCPNVQAGLQKWIAHRLKKSGARARLRLLISRRLSKRITIEAKRWKLDPIVMATIAWIESGYRPWARGRFGGAGRRQNEVGVWQLIPGDAPVVAITKQLLGCKPKRRMPPYLWRSWAYRYKGKYPCRYPAIAAHRSRVGSLSRLEMQGFVIGTFVAAYEMRYHIDACVARSPKRHRWPTPAWLRRWKKKNQRVDVTALERYLHYNWGGRQLPRNSYRRRLFARYPKVRDGVCGKQPKQPQQVARKGT